MFMESTSPRHRRARLIACVACALCTLAICAFSGCSQQRQSAQTENLSLVLKETDERDYIERAVSLYEEETGSTVDVIVYPDEEYEARVLEDFQSGQGPDILLHYNNSQLDAVGLDRFLVLNDQAWVDDLMEGSRAYSSDAQGNLLGLPFWESSISGCYYNKTIIDGLGLRMATTQSEFDTLCATLKSVGYTPLYWGGRCGWFYQFGLDPIFADDPELLERLNSGQIDYADIPQVRDMVQWISDANAKGWLYGATSDATLADVSGALATGGVVMVDIWDTWFAEDFEAQRYDASDFAVMPVFMGTADKGTYEGGNLNMMLVNKDGRHLDEAIGFVEFCASPAVYDKAFDGVPTVKVFKGQTTNETSDMVVDAESSIASLQRVSSAEPKILGYSQDDMVAAFAALFRGEVDVDGCIAMMDQRRIAARDAM